MKDAGKYNAIATDALKQGTFASRISAVSELVKIKITVLVSFTTALGYFLASRTPGFEFIFSSLGIFLLACSSAALNQYQESGTDVLMKRTSERPIPSGRISKQSALIITGLLFVAGSTVLILKANLPAYITGVVTFIWYNAVYTPLKKKTALAILPGSLVGALPPAAGWLAAGGNPLDVKILIVSAYFFVWQIPHFWLLLLLYGEDYRKGGFPVLTEKYSREFLKVVTFALLAATVLIAAAMPFAGIGHFAATKIILWLCSAAMLYGAYRFLSSIELKRKEIVGTFMAINLYTLLLITILSADKLFSTL